MPRLSTFSAASYRAWINIQENQICANSGYKFPLLVPRSVDGYTLSELGPAQIGPRAWTIDTGYIKYLINGQGRGVFGRGIRGDVSPSLYMLLYDKTGTGNYTYNFFDDCWQPGNPHEMGAIYVDGQLALGGGNEPDSDNIGIANSTVRSWQLNDNRIVVLMGNTAYGHTVFQYFSYPGESIVRMHMSYTNTTNIPHQIKIQRGGDPDYGQFPTSNGRGVSPVSASNVVYSIDETNDRTIFVYTPGNSYIANTSVLASWPAYDPDVVLSGINSGETGDYSIYAAWDVGTVMPGQTVFVTCFYIVDSFSSFSKYIC